MGSQGHRRVDRGARRAAAAGHRRHDPRLAHAGAQRRPHARSDRRAGDPADDGPALVLAAGQRVPRLRPHDERVLPGAGRQDPDVAARADAALARALSGRREHDGRGDGLRRQRPGRVEDGEHRHQPARAPARCRSRPCTSTARRRSRSKASASRRNSSRSSPTTCARPTAASRPRRTCGPSGSRSRSARRNRSPRDPVNPDRITTASAPFVTATSPLARRPQ